MRAPEPVEEEVRFPWEMYSPDWLLRTLNSRIQSEDEEKFEKDFLAAPLRKNINEKFSDDHDLCGITLGECKERPADVNWDVWLIQKRGVNFDF